MKPPIKYLVIPKNTKNKPSPANESSSFFGYPLSLDIEQESSIIYFSVSQDNLGLDMNEPGINKMP